MLTHCTPGEACLLEVPGINAAAPKANIIPTSSTDKPCESSTSVVSSSMLFSLERLGKPLSASQAQATLNWNAAEGIHTFSWGCAQGLTYKVEAI